MDKITMRHLDGLIAILNRITNSPSTYSNKRETGNFKANIGHYHLDQAYGGVRLARVVNENGGISSPISMPFGTKREAYLLIAAFIGGIEASK